MSRRPNAVPPVVELVKLTLHPGEDDDLIAWFNTLPDGLRAAAVKSALRGGTTLTTVSGDADDAESALDSLLS